MKQGHLLQKIIKRKCRSSITIYLTLMLVLVMALICTLIESGRVSAMNARLRSITYMAADSCFAEFAEPCFLIMALCFFGVMKQSLQRSLIPMLRTTYLLMELKPGMT